MCLLAHVSQTHGVYSSGFPIGERSGFKQNNEERRPRANGSVFQRHPQHGVLIFVAMHGSKRRGVDPGQFGLGLEVTVGSGHAVCKRVGHVFGRMCQTIRFLLKEKDDGGLVCLLADIGQTRVYLTFLVPSLRGPGFRQGNKE